MDRKKTIIAAAMINAGLLTVLFTLAMTTEEELPSAASFATLTPQLPQYMPSESLKYTEVSLPQKEVPPASSFLLPPAIEGVPAAKMPEPIQSQNISDIVVQKGDSLEKIAKKHGTSVDAILKFNQLATTFLKVGQHLKLPLNSKIEAFQEVLETSSQGAQYYTMKVGDNPWSIAMKHHMKVNELLKLNGLNEKTARKLKPGDRLRIQ